MTASSTIILGGGVTGLAAGRATGFPVLEAASCPGGICSSYYLRPGSSTRLSAPPPEENAYRFEIGGGHWIFGADPEILRFIQDLVPLRQYSRKSSVYLHEENLFVPYPIQNNLRHLDPARAAAALDEIETAAVRPAEEVTMEDSLRNRFGPTLCDLFFLPFHRDYTAGLLGTIAAQDFYKSPLDLDSVRDGARQETSPAGYNITYHYPEGGLDRLGRSLAEGCDIRYDSRVTRIDPSRRRITTANGDELTYDRLVSTLPLNRLLEISGLALSEKPDPFTSVLVLNIGARRGPRCPDDHWLYLPGTGAGFYRVGFYDNVDVSFLPAQHREPRNHTSIYVESAYPPGERPTPAQTDRYAATVVEQLRAWEFIGEVEVVDPTWIDVGYTWRRPGSSWREEAIAELEKRDILSVGRYGRWNYQGIAASIAEGLALA